MQNTTKRQQMIEQLQRLAPSTRVRWQGRTYIVLDTQWLGGALCKTRTGWLEEGKPATYQREGIGLAKGRMVELSNVLTRELKAQSMYMDFEIVD